MTAFDRIVCEYPLSDPRDQDREFVTRELGGWGRDRYVITRDGRLIRHAPVSRQGLEPVRDVEWPVDGHIGGEQKLVMFLLTTMGLARVAALVGRKSWLAAVEDEG